jgi:peptide/nickel transport system permease protein
MDMRRFLVRKTVYLTVTMFAILVTNFLMFRVMPGNPARAFAPKGITPEIEEMILERFHLTEPLLTQFYYYMLQVVQLDFGVSSTLRPGAEVANVIAPMLVNTVALVGVGTVGAIFAGIALGRYVAWRRGQAADTVGMAFTLTFYSMPTYILALAFLMFFAGYLDLFPLKGAYGELPFVHNPPSYTQMNILEKLISRGYHLILPASAFALQYMADFVLIMRNSLTDVLTEDYIVTARAKGLSNEAILKDHASRNALLPVVTVIAISIGWVLGGEIMVELIFSYEGIGQLTWDAVYKRDYPVLQALFLIMSVAVLVANLLADIIYTYLDPRVSV